MLSSVDLIARAVSGNCNISDAAHAGVYSVCTLALLLRDLYKWNIGLSPWEEKGAEETLAWIGEREALWDTITETEFIPIPIDGVMYDPFDTLGINAALDSHGLCYGAGYAQALKPTFFLAVCEKTDLIHGITLKVSGRELARDLLTLPALTQDDGILFRGHSARMFFWDQILYIRKSGRVALEFALKACGIPDARPATVKAGFERAFSIQVKNYIHHEVGEIRDTGFDRALWREILSEFPHTPLELVARVVKDTLADTNPLGTLPRIIAEENVAALGFYAAFRGPLSKKLFPEFDTGFGRFAQTSDWAAVRAATEAMRESALTAARLISGTFLAGKETMNLQGVRKELECRFLGALSAVDHLDNNE